MFIVDRSNRYHILKFFNLPEDIDIYIVNMSMSHERGGKGE